MNTIHLFGPGVLSEEQYQRLRAEQSSQEKMRKLYELLPSWDTWHKDQLFRALTRTNRDLLEELEGPHFVDQHREQLIQRATEVDKLLFFVRATVLNYEKYESISAGRTSVEKMQKLYELAPSWRRVHKDKLYRALRLTNFALVEELEGEHFVERHWEQLIQRASSVDTVLELLRRCELGRFPDWHLMPGLWTPLQSVFASMSLPRLNREKLEQVNAVCLSPVLGVLSDEQCQQLTAEQSSQEKMRKLYELVPSWDTQSKDQLYRAIEETNGDLVEELEGPHFVDQHREQLIQRVTEVDRFLLCLRYFVLNDEQYQSIRTGRTNVEKMQKLYELAPSWRRAHKDKLCWVLRQINTALVEELEGASSQAQESSTSPSLGATGEHFVERHREQLIQRASSVDTVLELLRRSELGPVLMWTVHRMPLTVLSGCSMSSTGKPRERISTEVTLPSDLTSEETKSEPSSAAASIVCQQTHRPSPGSAAEATGETSQSQNPTACLRGQDKCGWCAREEEVLPEEVKPESIQDPEGNQEMYRVHFSQPGWFRCPKTELEFEVRAPVTVQYGYGSWRQHLTESLEGKGMVAGPLFDIRVEPAEAVSAVHLLHFLCLREADRSQVQIAHFIEEGMTLQNPTRVRPFHAMLENPRFSLIGVFWLWREKNTPIHSIVLLYQAQKRVNLTFHLYLIPDDGFRIKAAEVYEDKCQSWFVSKSHFTSRPLCFGTCCAVSSPSAITVTPKELPFLDKPADTLQPFTEVHTKDFKEELELNLEDKSDKTPVWEAVIRAEDLRPSDSSTKMETDTHFVDRHREQLIQRVTTVDSILDLLCGPVLDTEQYESVRAERTNPAKMRRLYELAPSWSTHLKERFYQALREKHRHLVEELEGR